jgi:hypothetical protein
VEIIPQGYGKSRDWAAAAVGVNQYTGSLRQNSDEATRTDETLADMASKARANQQGGQGGVLLPENSPEATRTDET